ncbi:P-loop NTPase fold protein [Pseudomonas viridiflava]|uniref:P-loop NTPase fold protein n=1 Tax=Pseudomonas viridiflava TaxID=33069 RepID=UPI000F02FE39|nr:P-loop NTPase fold protein [Pseudomonas viridiflava]
MNPNQKVFDYLTYYKDLATKPKYAVALTGHWGSGKTFFIDNFLAHHYPTPDPKDYIYISLYGLERTEELNEAIFKEIYPSLNNKGVKIMSSIAKSVLSYLRLNITLKPNEILDLPPPKLYIFDDFERCNIPLDNLMGYINNLLEKDGSKLIIITNENEIKDSESYIRKKEKIIGKTFKIHSDTEAALSVFTNEISNIATRLFLAEHRSEILSIYKRSDTFNLRILQQVYLEFDRIYGSIDQDQKLNAAAMVTLIRLIFTWSIELRQGRLNEHDLSKRGSYEYRVANDSETNFSIARLRYDNFDLCEDLLSTEVLTDILIHGHVDKDDIRRSLSSSSFFGHKDMPSWRVAWNHHTVTNDKLEEALNDVEAKFSAREYTIPGEILHVAGIRLWSSKINYLNRSPNEIESELFNYVDDLLKKDLLEPTLPYPVYRLEAHAGLGYKEKESEAFKSCSAYLIKKRVQAANNLRKTQAMKMSSLISENALHFCELITDRSTNNSWGMISFLNFIPPQDFIESFLKADPAHQELITRSLFARYNRAQPSGEFEVEAPWLTELLISLRESLKSRNLFDRVRIQDFIEWYLEPKSP